MISHRVFLLTIYFTLNPIVAIKNILQGDIFSEKNLGLRRPGYGLPPKMIFELFGKKSKKEIMKGKLIDSDDF